MNLAEIFEESISVLRTNKMRTALSVLGIVIGIGSVIALMTLGQSSQQSIKQRIQSLGSNLLIIRPGSSQEGFLRGSSGGVKTLTLEDAKVIKSSPRVTTVALVAAEYTSRSQVSYGRNNTNIQVSGVIGDYFKLRNIELVAGSEITQANSQNLDKVAVLGPTAAQDLFGNDNPIGSSVRINGSSFTVIGVTKSKGTSGGGLNSDEAVYVPLLTAQRVLFGVSYVSNIYVGAKDEKRVEAAQNQIGYLLLERHRKVTPADADFSIFSTVDLLQTASDVTKTFTSLLTGIAAISLIVGGIGIMNIMLVTVTERTMEIGLRKALGAKKKTIITQFLIEAVVLTVVGGMFGIFLGILVSFILTKVMTLPFSVSLSSVGLAVIVSSVIGILFGWYPAYKASNLQPIEALRYE